MATINVPTFGGVEAGGTNFVCGIGSGPQDLITQEFPTNSPAETIARVAAFFRAHPVDSVGVGCFGPIDLSAGRITNTPKTAWRDFPIVEALQQATGISRIAFDTDVNAAAMGENEWGAGQGVPDFLYLTVGTGIGGGAMVNGRLLHGKGHPEMGHLLIRRDPTRDPFEGTCYAHGDCLEGLASGFAIEIRWNQPGKQIPLNHEAWSLETEYLAQALAAYTCTLAPAKIILGGGVMHSLSYAAIHKRLSELLNGYVPTPEVIPPQLGDNAGVLGAIAMAAQITSDRDALTADRSSGRRD